MPARTMLLAAALIIAPAVSASAPASAQDAQPAMPPAPDNTAAPSPTNGAHVNTATPAVVPANQGDLQAGVTVYDATGGKVGTIESVNSTGAVVFTGTARATIPVTSFSKSSQGLVIGATRAQLEAAVAQAAAAKP